MKTFRFVIMTLTLTVLSAALSSCDKEDKASIAFNGEIEDIRAFVINCYPTDNLNQESNTTISIKSLHDNNFPISFDFYAEAYGYGVDDEYDGYVSLTFNILGVVYDADGNEVRRKTASPTNRRIGTFGSPYLDDAGYTFQIMAYAGETIHLTVTSVSYEGTVSKRFGGFYVSATAYYDCVSGGSTYQSGEMYFEGYVRK